MNRGHGLKTTSVSLFLNFDARPARSRPVDLTDVMGVWSDGLAATGDESCLAARRCCRLDLDQTGASIDDSKVLAGGSRPWFLSGRAVCGGDAARLRKKRPKIRATRVPACQAW